MRKTRYFLDDTGGIKIPASLTKAQIELMSQMCLRKGMKEVSREKWFVAKKKKEWSGLVGFWWLLEL